jgi:putative tricarboxylic transport membrane protein
MSGDGNAANEGPAHRNIELATAAAMGVFGAIVVYGALLAGIGWGFEGPRAGFFPFIIGVSLVLATGINLWNALQGSKSKVFAEWDQLKQVGAVTIPILVYVALIPFIGIYFGSMILIAYFMMRISDYGPVRTALIAILVPLITFIVFERWFLVALPKGPIEAMLGF